MTEARVLICNDKGLHARAASRFARTANQFDSKIIVTANGMTAMASSIMGLMMLTAAKGCEITITAEGTEEDEAITALVDLVQAGFHE